MAVGRLNLPFEYLSLGSGWRESFLTRLCSDQHQKTWPTLFGIDGWWDSEENFWGSTHPKAVPSLSGSRAPGVASFRPFLLPVVVIQPCHWAAEETIACCFYSVLSGVDREGPGPDFSPTFTDLFAFHYFPMTHTNTTFNMLIKLQLINNNKFLWFSDC